MIEPKARAQAAAAGVQFDLNLRGDGRLSNREADLISLILENLLQNAMEATGSGKSVELGVTATADRTVFEVRDEGPGLPPGLEARLFMPCTSGKKGGGGIGLAISRQLAQSLGARLELVVNRPTGCMFRLTVRPSPVDALPQIEGGRGLALN